MISNLGIKITTIVVENLEKRENSEDGNWRNKTPPIRNQFQSDSHPILFDSISTGSHHIRVPTGA